jgi:hypothetical protein
VHEMTALPDVLANGPALMSRQEFDSNVNHLERNARLQADGTTLTRLAGGCLRHCPQLPCRDHGRFDDVPECDCDEVTRNDAPSGTGPRPLIGCTVRFTLLVDGTGKVGRTAVGDAVASRGTRAGGVDA